MNGPGHRFRRWWARRSIRSRLALWYAAGGTLLLTGFAATLYSYVALRLARPLDHQLRGDFAVVDANLRIGPDRQLLWAGQPLANPAPWIPEHPWFEIWDDTGKLVRRVWPFPEHEPLRLPGPPNRDPGTATISVFNVAPDLRVRTLSIRLPPGPHHRDWRVRLLRVHQPYADALPELQLIILVSLPVVVAALVLGGYFFTRRWLLPLDLMGAAAERISAEDLDRRLPVANPDDELGRLARVFNGTLDRLQHSFAALDRFVAEASHELRTPLTALRSVGESGLRRSRTPDEYREVVASMLEEAQRLQTLVERLLELASAAGGRPAVHRTALRLDETVAACVQELGILAEQRSQRIVVTAAPCTAVTDPVLLRQALQNLLDNAIKFSPDGAAIRVGVAEEPDTIDITVTDEGEGLPPDHRARLARPFFRSRRADRRGGFGLGIPLTDAYVRLLGGTLACEPAPGRGSIFRIRLPRG